MRERIPNPRAIGKGRLEIGGGLYVEADGSLPCGESLVRQCLYGKRYFKHKFGVDVKTAWFQDAWTHPWTYPQILKKSGIDSYMFTRPRVAQGEKMFWWQSPDGSRVFAYKPMMSDIDLPPQKRLDKHLTELNRKYGVKDGIVLVGVGNHGGGAIKADVERMKKTMAERTKKTVTERPAEIKFSTPTKFLEAALGQQGNFPVVSYELPPTIRGAYTTVGEIKKGNRQSENLLMTLEKFSSIAARLVGFPYPQADLNQAWKKVMLNQFHDTISGTDVPPSIEDALKRYRQILAMGNRHLQESLKAISSRINTKGQGVPIIIFNPLSWQRTDPVEMELEFAEAIESVKLTDARGKPVPVQLMSLKKKDGKIYLRFVFIAEDVPSLGYKSYRAIPDSSTPSHPSSLKASKHEIENEFFRVQIDPVTGCLKSVFDKNNKREVLDKVGMANLIQIIEDHGDSEGFLRSADLRRDPHYKWTGKYWDVDSNPEIELLESGPVRAMVQVKKKFELARFTQRIVLYPKIPKIDFDLAIDWEGKHKMVKVSFPISVSVPEATYEIPYGTISRPSIGEEHAAQKWVDISGSNYGVSLLNDSRYGYDVKDNIIRLSVLRSPAGPVYATDEKGVHTLKYSLYPHQGSWQQANVMQKGYELNYPLIAFADTVHDGDLPSAYSFIKIEPENLILTVVKKAEDSDDLILRFYETKGKRCTAKVVLAEALAVDAVHKTNLLENSLSETETDGRSFQASAGAYAIESFKLIKDLD